MNKGHIVTAVIRGRARKAFSIFMTAMLTLSMVPSTQAVAEVLQSQETEPAVEVHAPEGAFSAGTTASMVSAGAQDVIDAASDGAPVAAVEKVRGKQVTGGHEIDMAQVAAVSASDGLRPGWNFDGWYTETTNNTNVTVKRTFVLITTLKPL